jgi:phosphoglucosamine mutase
VRKLFGTDGIRGTANREPVTCETALALGRAVAHLCKNDCGSLHPAIVIGRDTRLSGDMLESALSAGACSMGADVLLAGTLPTPGIAFLTCNLGAAAGVVISASHNPFADNGIKFFARTGFKLPDAAEEEIERFALGGGAETMPTGSAIGRVRHIDDALERYAAALRSAVPAERGLRGLKIALDCAHGAAYRVGPRVLEEAGADVVTMGVNPDGENINCGCGALHPGQLQGAVVAEKAHMGIALDGDADRAMLVDETGTLVDGDEVLAMLATEMQARGTLKQGTVVATVMSNIGLEIALRERGARLERVQVGDRYVVEAMLRHGYNLGGEQSGHIVVLDRSTTGDGLVAALSVLGLMIERQRPLSELRLVMSKFPQALINVRVRSRRDLNELPPVRSAIERIGRALGDRGRVLVRYSGTEPLVRVMVEGERPAEVQAYAEEIAATLRAQLGASA